QGEAPHAVARRGLSRFTRKHLNALPGASPSRIEGGAPGAYGALLEERPVAGDWRGAALLDCNALVDASRPLCRTGRAAPVLVPPGWCLMGMASLSTSSSGAPCPIRRPA